MPISNIKAPVKTTAAGKALAIKWNEGDITLLIL
jgi:hypothetical protein